MYQGIEYEKIILGLKNHALTEGAKQKIEALKPYLDQGMIESKLNDTTESKVYLEKIGTPPLGRLKGIDEILSIVEIGGMLTPEQLEEINDFVTASERMKAYLRRGEIYELNLSGYGYSLHDLSALKIEIENTIRNGMVDDGASSQLRSIRSKIEVNQMQLKEKLESLLRSKKSIFSDSYIAERNGRFVLPVKKSCKGQITGTVIDSSATGSTLFIEPAAVAKLSENLNYLRIDEDNEVRKILYQLTTLVWESVEAIKINIDALETLDFIFAKGKLSCEMEGISPAINCQRKIVIKQGHHPLISKTECVPLDFKIGDDVFGVVITGPNTGGKTVALKTVGLLSAMACSGLHIPCQDANIGINNGIFCDIGDGQSITENLSTFSAHITSVINILERADENSLVLLDELGSGTDPAEGMGIAIAILEELRKKKCLFVATTHYPEVKDYALEKQGLQNARMAFDRESLKPLYRLEMGEAGESCALYIAKRLGLPKHMLMTAYEAAYCRQQKDAKQEHIIPKSALESDIFEGAREQLKEIKGAKIKPKQEIKQFENKIFEYHIGDGVIVLPEEKLAIVCRPANEKGEVLIQIQKKKQLVNHKRLKLKTKAEEMYPEDYDFSVIFDTVANRKARKKIEKGHGEGYQIIYDEEF